MDWNHQERICRNSNRLQYEFYSLLIYIARASANIQFQSHCFIPIAIKCFWDLKLNYFHLSLLLLNIILVIFLCKKNLFSYKTAQNIYSLAGNDGNHINLFIIWNWFSWGGIPKTLWIVFHSGIYINLHRCGKTYTVEMGYYCKNSLFPKSDNKSTSNFPFISFLKVLGVLKVGSEEIGSSPCKCSPLLSLIFVEIKKSYTKTLLILILRILE